MLLCMSKVLTVNYISSYIFSKLILNVKWRIYYVYIYYIYAQHTCMNERSRGRVYELIEYSEFNFLYDTAKKIFLKIFIKIISL